jgi:hypothetical protein
MNPLSITWELIPYSFVVDWFVDIGSYLRNFETGLLYNSIFLSGYKSELYRYGAELTCGFAQHVSGDMKYIARDLNAMTRRVEFSRTVLGTYPLPNRPSIKADLGSSQLLSAAALLRQFLSK